MSGVDNKILFIGLLFLLTIVTGFWLYGKGNPPPSSILTIHKVAVIGNMYFLNKMFFDLRKAGAVDPSVFVLMIAMNVLFIGTIATGGLLSIETKMPNWIKTAHLVTPWLTIIASVAMLFKIGK